MPVKIDFSKLDKKNEKTPDRVLNARKKFTYFYIKEKEINLSANKYMFRNL